MHGGNFPNSEAKAGVMYAADVISIIGYEISLLVISQEISHKLSLYQAFPLSVQKSLNETLMGE